MTIRHTATPFWSTASFGDQPGTSPTEVSGLSEHLDACKGLQGRWFNLQCMAEAADRFLAARLVTTLVIAASLIGLAALVM